MATGDSHVAGSDGWPLCGASGPLRGYNATSPDCRDCAELERKVHWASPALPTTAPALPPRTLLRPIRLTVKR